MNSKLLRAKMVENDVSVYRLAELLGLNPATVRLKIQNDGFKVNEARAIARELSLTSSETQAIFFAS